MPGALLPPLAGGTPGHIRALALSESRYETASNTRAHARVCAHAHVCAHARACAVLFFKAYPSEVTVTRTTETSIRPSHLYDSDDSDDSDG